MGCVTDLHSGVSCTRCGLCNCLDNLPRENLKTEKRPKGGKGLRFYENTLKNFFVFP